MADCDLALRPPHRQYVRYQYFAGHSGSIRRTVCSDLAIMAISSPIRISIKIVEIKILRADFAQPLSRYELPDRGRKTPNPLIRYQGLITGRKNQRNPLRCRCVMLPEVHERNDWSTESLHTVVNHPRIEKIYSRMMTNICLFQCRS